MRKLIVSEFVTLDGVMQAPAEGRRHRWEFEHGGWTIPYWHDAIGERFGKLLADVDTLLLGRRTYVIHGEAFDESRPGSLRGGEEVRRLQDAEEASLARHDDHSRQRRPGGARAEGAAEASIFLTGAASSFTP